MPDGWKRNGAWRAAEDSNIEVDSALVPGVRPVGQMSFRAKKSW